MPSPPAMPRWLQIIWALGGLAGIVSIAFLLVRPAPSQSPFAPVSVERPLHVVSEDPVVLHLRLCNESNSPQDVMFSYSFQNIDTGEVVFGNEGTLPRPANTCLDEDVPLNIPPVIGPGLWRITGHFLVERQDDTLHCPTPVGGGAQPTCTVLDNVLQEQRISFVSEEFNVR